MIYYLLPQVLQSLYSHCLNYCLIDTNIVCFCQRFTCIFVVLPFGVDRIGQNEIKMKNVFQDVLLLYNLADLLTTFDFHLACLSHVCINFTNICTYFILTIYSLSTFTSLLDCLSCL